MRPGSTIIEGRLAPILLPLSAWLLAIAPASAQQPAPPPPTTTAPAPAPTPGQAPTPAATAGPVADVTTKYRFFERYAVGNEAAAPGALGAYRVGIRDQKAITVDQGAGAPERINITYQAVFTERTAAVNSLDDKLVTDVVRRYEKFRLVDSRNPPDLKPANPPYLDGMTLWITAGLPKKVMCLTEGRRLRIPEFEYAQWQVFIPAFAYALPDIDCRIGDEWQLTPTGTATLLGGFMPESGSLTGKLLEVKADPKGPTRSAIFKVTGSLKLDGADCAVNAQITFNFTPQEVSADPAKKAAPSVVEARGGITGIVLGQRTVKQVTPEDPKGKRRIVTSRDYQFQRELRPDRLSLDVPVPSPQPNEENSWLTFDDPQEPFQFRFPQDMRQVRTPKSYILERGSEQDGLEQIVIMPLKKSDPLSDPEVMRKDAMTGLADDYDITTGAAAYLPDGDWPRLRVYRWDAYLRPKDKEAASQRTVLALGYSIVTGRDQAFYVEAKSNREPLLPIRNEVESILHTLVVDPKRK